MSDAETRTTPVASPAIGRRTVLRGAAAIGGVAVVAACGGDAETPTAAGTSNTPSDSTPTGGGGGNGGDDGGDDGGDNGGAGGTVLGPAADVPVGSGLIYATDQVVVTQPSRGDFKAFSSTCTHAGCPVTTVTKTINCACHGSVYSIADGSVIDGPAPRPLAAKDVTVNGANLVLG